MKEKIIIQIGSKHYKVLLFGAEDFCAVEVELNGWLRFLAGREGEQYPQPPALSVLNETLLLSPAVELGLRAKGCAGETVRFSIGGMSFKELNLWKHVFLCQGRTSHRRGGEVTGFVSEPIGRHCLPVTHYAASLITTSRTYI
jgi:hypothetical protein